MKEKMNRSKKSVGGVEELETKKMKRKRSKKILQPTGGEETPQCTMSNHGGTSYNLRETQEREERQWCSQMEYRMSAMTKAHQKAIHDLTTVQEMNMALILELLQNQRNDGVAGHALVGPGPDPLLAPLHGGRC
ncbi:hypothetical protein Syun_010363 [Stephania yunnanensis]|uniref:Uncharacterized protein n=1 Tax=Stephania yunnanensis TaxID=152371 RepID=A0AAP0KIH2_9MAGN